MDDVTSGLLSVAALCVGALGDVPAVALSEPAAGNCTRDPPT
jgi:hypothetical protein